MQYAPYLYIALGFVGLIVGVLLLNTIRYVKKYPLGLPARCSSSAPSDIRAEVISANNKFYSWVCNHAIIATVKFMLPVAVLIVLLLYTAQVLRA
jgi:hypothetical protein